MIVNLASDFTGNLLMEGDLVAKACKRGRAAELELRVIDQIEGDKIWVKKPESTTNHRGWTVGRRLLLVRRNQT